MYGSTHFWFIHHVFQNPGAGWYQTCSKSFWVVRYILKTFFMESQAIILYIEFLHENFENDLWNLILYVFKKCEICAVLFGKRPTWSFNVWNNMYIEAPYSTVLHIHLNIDSTLDRHILEKLANEALNMCQHQACLYVTYIDVQPMHS